MAIVINQFRWVTPRAIVESSCKRAILDACEFVLQETNKIVPLDESPLMQSGDVDCIESPIGFEASVFYDTPYAIYVHEHPEFNFQNNREGKYLEKTVNRVNPRIEAYLARRIRQAFIGSGPI